MNCPDEAVLIEFLESERPGQSEPDVDDERPGQSEPDVDDERLGQSELKEHLNHCPECRETLEQLRCMSRVLAASAPASLDLCPRREVLTRFVEEREASRELLSHIANCPRCRSEIKDYEALISNEEKDGQLFALLQGEEFSLLCFSPWQVKTLEGPPLRGRSGKRRKELHKDWGDGEIKLSLSSRQGRQCADLSITIDPKPIEEARIRVELVDRERILEARSVPTEGKLVLDELEFGDYRVIVRDLVDGKKQELKLRLL